MREAQKAQLPAHDTCVAMNGRYLLDGHDPNGYSRVAQTIAGLHDRPRLERDLRDYLLHVRRV